MKLQKYEIEKILKDNMTEKGFSLWKALNERLPDIWNKPTSFLGKYHKKGDGTVPDIIEHVYQMLYAAVKLFRMFSINPKTSQADILLIAIVLHDSLKYGNNGERLHTDSEHDKTAADMVNQNKKIFEKIFNENQVQLLEDSIRFHSGQWSTDILNRDEFNFADRDPIVQWVHTLDMLSTADLIKM